MQPKQRKGHTESIGVGITISKVDSDTVFSCDICVMIMVAGAIQKGKIKNEFVLVNNLTGVFFS